MLGYKIITSTSILVDEYTSQNSVDILNHFSQCSDILLFLQSALAREAFDLKYSLQPPYTTSNLDSDYILRKLIDLKLVEDCFFSSISNSYRISINRSATYSLNDILCIGLNSLLSLSYGYFNEALTNVCIKKKNKCISADLACSVKGKILFFNFELSSGLENSVASHTEQLKKLSYKVIQTYTYENSNIKKYFIVSQHCKSLLPEYNCVIPINQISDFINNITPY